MYEENAFFQKSVEYWCLEFKCGKFFVTDTPKTGRPQLDDIDLRILSTLNNYPFKSLLVLIEACNCSIGTIYNYWTNVLGYKNYTLQWIPFFLTETNHEFFVC